MSQMEPLPYTSSGTESPIPDLAVGKPRRRGRRPDPSAAGRWLWTWLGSHTFAPPWLPGRWRHPAIGYAAAVLVQGLAVLLTLALVLTFPGFAFRSALVLLGVALIALNWGAGPSLVAAVLGAQLLEFVVLMPRLTVTVASTGDGIATALVAGVGLVISVLASSTERSKRRAVEERAEARARELAARQTQEHMDEFLATASHDLRTPLTAALGYQDLAAGRFERLATAMVDACPELAGQAEGVRANLSDAAQANVRLRRLLDLLLDTTQARAGVLDLRRAPCDLELVVREQVAALRVANPRRTVRLETATEGPVRVVADADRIGQVVANYVTNALKYSPAARPVAVHMAVEGARARVAVADRGPGLPAHERERVWERFYRAEGVRAQAGSSAGLGLGLHICKAIVEGHGGQVGVESEVGRGSTFWFTLPLADRASGQNDGPR